MISLIPFTDSGRKIRFAFGERNFRSAAQHCDNEKRNRKQEWKFALKQANWICINLRITGAWQAQCRLLIQFSNVFDALFWRRRVLNVNNNEAITKAHNEALAASYPRWRLKLLKGERKVFPLNRTEKQFKQTRKQTIDCCNVKHSVVRSRSFLLFIRICGITNFVFLKATKAMMKFSSFNNGSRILKNFLILSRLESLFKSSSNSSQQCQHIYYYIIQLRFAY